MAKVEAMVSALRRENNRYLAAIANVSAAVAELSDTVEALQRQLGTCNVAASQALRMAGEGGSIVEELGWIVWMLAGIGLLLLIKSPRSCCCCCLLGAVSTILGGVALLLWF